MTRKARCFWLLMAMLLGCGWLWQQSRRPAECFWQSRAACLQRLSAGLDKQPSEVWRSGPRHDSAQLQLARDGRYQIYAMADDVDGRVDVAEVGHWQEARGELTLQPQLGGEAPARWHRQCFQGQYYLTRSPHPRDMARRVQAWHQDRWDLPPPLPGAEKEAETLWRGGQASDCPGA
ncbi:hypothetical protein [Chromobacterium violaceum]|uniref:Uncharacterized protein n=1 Tax=Chromobacterium violaceum TaxID=536 RepID=A0A202B9S7_CHRVL|nr:hypothetical protein [Chromobacterium violaceum]MBA8733351.1 hypothetical protein [Chromobacterium violaceum]OVE48090.1 hypothetical protein CBW21_11565 [Chromobacterium violaceum]